MSNRTTALKFKTSLTALPFRLGGLAITLLAYYMTGEQLITLILAIYVMTEFVFGASYMWDSEEFYIPYGMVLAIGFSWTLGPVFNWDVPAVYSEPIVMPILMTFVCVFFTSMSFLFGTAHQQPFKMYFGKRSGLNSDTTKQPAVAKTLTQEQSFSETLQSKLNRYHGYELGLFATPQSYESSEMLFSVFETKNKAIEILADDPPDGHIGYCDRCKESKQLSEYPWFVHVTVWWRLQTIHKVNVCQECAEDLIEESVANEESDIETEDVVAHAI